MTPGGACTIHAQRLDPPAPMQLSTDRILAKVKELADPLIPQGGSFLDIGSGTGALISALRGTHPQAQSFACDYTDALMKAPGQRVDVVDLNHGNLPYEDNRFDVVTCTEVVEHLENYRHIVREMHRVLKPGGSMIVTTPNVLNIQSRVRFLFFGFWNLFGPLPVGRAEQFSTVGHITPVSYFYLVHAMAEAGLRVSGFDIDKAQRSGVAKLVVFGPLIALFSALARRREVRRFRTIDESNEAFVRNMNSAKMLLGRTIVVVAAKP
jgi:ubiquinone/menaquinone biosynthesis C-methylase UbiE